MVNPNKTAIVGLFDNSGSMSQFDMNEFAGSINNIIKEQCETSEVLFYGATFSDSFELFADGVNGREVNITKKDLQPSGLTVLIPAFARMIRFAGSRFSDMNEEDRPGKVIFILLSDGEQTFHFLRNRIAEDRPYEGSGGQNNLRELISEHEHIWKWEFMFLGTSFDSITVGASLGLNKSKCLNFATTDTGLRTAMNCVSKNMSKIRMDDYSGFDEEDRTSSMKTM